jgi:voltage-gated potassium channel
LGKLLASFVMITGYGILAVPTGIVTVEMAHQSPKAPVSTQTCPECAGEGHDVDARFCKHCGARR